MKPLILASVLAIVAATPAVAAKNPPQDCLAHFAVVYVDRLNNTNRGLQGKQLKDVEDKMKQYGDICYTADEQSALMIFFIHTKPAVYHGTQTTTDTETNPIRGTVESNSGREIGTIEGTEKTTTTSEVPYEVDYSVFILDIIAHGKGIPPDKFPIVRTFDQKGLYRTWAGFGYGKGKNPIVNVIDSAAKWLHENNAVWMKNPGAESTSVAAAKPIEHPDEPQAPSLAPVAAAPLASHAVPQQQPAAAPVADVASAAPAQADPATVNIKSRPDGADITIDGKFVGSTPSTVRVTPGDHEIVIQKAGSNAGKIPGGEVSLPSYRMWKRILTLSPGGTITVDATLEPIR